MDLKKKEYTLYKSEYLFSDRAYLFFEDFINFWLPNYRKCVQNAKYDNDEEYLIEIKDNLLKNWNMNFEMKKYILKELGIFYLLQDNYKEKAFLRNEKLIYLALKRKSLLSRIDELYDVGLIGLTNAINTYDKTKNYKESTYFYKCIINEINKYIYLQNCSKRKCPTSIISLDYEFDGSDGTTYADLISDPNVNLEEEIILKEREEKIHNAISKLKPSYQEIIKKYYGIGTIPKNIAKLAKEKGVSRETINQKRNRALKQLKTLLEKEEIFILEEEKN